MPRRPLELGLQSPAIHHGTVKQEVKQVAWKLHAGGRVNGESGYPLACGKQHRQWLGAHDRDRLAEQHDALARDVERSFLVTQRGARDRLGRVILVDELQARVEAEETWN